VSPSMVSGTERVGVDRRDDGVVVVTLDHPPVNALSTAVLGEIEEIARALSATGDVKAVVVRGAGKAFAAGADVSEFGGPDEARSISQAFRHAFDAVAAIPRPVIAAIHGVALGGGLELALACDVRLAAASARLGQPEIALGIIPGAGGTQRLPRLVGPARAKELVFSGEAVRAEQAREFGLVDRVVADEALEGEALAWASALARGAVAAMGLAKRAIDAGLDGPLAQGLDVEAEAFVEVFRTEDARTGIESFREQGPGKARFSGR